MTSNKEISTELLSLSPTLAAIPATNVFRVPDNYFNELPANILQLVQSDIIPSFSKAEKSSLSVPEGYFDGLASSLLNKIKAEAAGESPAEEINNLSAVISRIGKENVLTVPEGYFEELTSSVLKKLKVTTAETAEEEIRSLSPVIANIGRQNIFSAPEGYFDTVSVAALDNVAPKAKVVEMKKHTGWVKYMAAATVAGIIGLSIFNYTNHTSGSSKTGYQPELLAEANKIVTNQSFDKELNALSDKDIEDFLKANGEDVDAALVATTTADEANLPSPEEYIIDDNTLENFLKKVNLNN